ncbi:MAG: efflux RND transporter periplasmic adaptor subunit [Gemmatimonadaceae bacterium]|jgi:RND family efflux transporter MFP subunit|nr:efflux RND transporter periplasmic adaptor subunit [Gemmatimonadaceae bacterium]
MIAVSQRPARIARPALLFVSLAALAACGGREATANDGAAEAPAVVIGPENIVLAARDSVRTGPILTGALVPSREARLRAELSGRVIATLVEPGTTVSAGTVLARIDDASLQDDLLSAKTAVTSASLAAEQATRELERARTLGQAGAIATRDVEAAERAQLQAQAQLDAAKARQASSAKSLGNTVVRAPFAGVVSERAVSAGDVVSPGTALFTVVDPRSLRLEAQVPADAVSALRVGAPVTFALNGYPDRTFEGRITRVSPVADAVTRQVGIIAELPNRDGRLVGGLFAEGRVASDVRDAIVVPEVAVDQRGPSPTVMRLSNGRVEAVDVALGLRDPARERIEIVSGLAAGDTVLLGGARGISVGTAVTVRAVTDASAAPPAPSTSTPSSTPPAN